MTRAEAARTFDHGHRLLSHAAAPAWNPEERIRAAEARLRAGKDLPGATVEQQIDMLYALTRFPLGRFLLENQGLNAYWTHELVTYRPGTFAEHQAGGLEYQIFEKMPAVLATRERFHLFRRQLQERLRPGITIASVPCGLMGDLLSLDFGAAPDVSLIGIDLDQQALDGARALALERGMSSQVTLRREDAWAGSLSGEADILTSNGLNIYEPNDERVIALYRAFFVALKPGGTLITSFLTPPPTVGAESSWDLSQIDQSSLALQYVLFAHILEVKWSAFRTQAQTRAQLERAGFTDIRFVDDRARMFPTVIARKPE
ncbi:SAM-dependent methyltransferase [Cupriavidus gilardii]|uniref:SAM-dependent methyltransferase n=1 Tax=Cupriavidus gilardii TaxID=82541 RepID=UPI001ABE63D9|nr:class I SAM-dependent methyltransferase [Cupriavidus gilardii]MBO4123354.1 SAM-dependent methyltransferase [Cupriavidus gilardii]